MKTTLILLSFLSLPLFAANRPNLQIKIQDAFICKAGKSQGKKIYSRFCKAKNFINTSLFIKANPSTEIIYGELMSENAETKGSLFSWCTSKISDGRIGPSCVLELTNIKTNAKERLSLNIGYNSNFATANLSSIAIGTRYNARIVENGSGSNASSEVFEVVVK